MFSYAGIPIKVHLSRGNAGIVMMRNAGIVPEKFRKKISARKKVVS